MKNTMFCPRCFTSRYTVRIVDTDTCRCDGCGREAANLTWNDAQPDDVLDSPFFTDPEKRSEVPENTPGVRAKMLAEYNNKQEALVAKTQSALAEIETVKAKREQFINSIEDRLLVIEKMLGIKQQ